jgi:hypothetical protein
MNTVYVKTDANGRITAVNSDAFLNDPTGWAAIDTGCGDAYLHAQGLYLPRPLTDERGRYRYRLENGAPVERTQAELDAEGDPPAADPVAALQAENALLRAQIQAVSDRGDFVEDCITEMAEKVYGDA